MTDPREMVSVRYMVDDVAKAVDFYTTLLGFEVLHSYPPFADVARGWGARSAVGRLRWAP